MERLQYHFEPGKGWMNDPNGLVYFRGRYHAFFQHYPYAPRWGQMHWGHAVSDDLIHWEELPIALYPDQPYEDDGGCFSGSAIVKDDRLYLFYTSVSYELKQTQSVAWSDDGIHFTKYEGNPVIRENPLGYPDFRDPKVSCIDGVYHMVVGTGDASSGKVLLFRSGDLLHWDYAGVLFEGEEYAHCIECPDLFPLGDKYVLMFSKIGGKERATHFAVGDLRDGKLVDYRVCCPEHGPDFYAPQSFSHPDGRRILIGWFYHWGKELPTGATTAGALSIPRELSLKEGRICNYPAAEARHLLTESSPYVKITGTTVAVFGLDGKEVLRKDLKGINGLEEIEKAEILFDTKAVEIFINEGLISLSQWLI